MDNDDPWVFLPRRESVPGRPPETAREVIRWWERRRLKYNLLVVGLYSACAFVGVLLYPNYLSRTGLLTEWPLLVIFRIIYLIAIVIASNVCYTLGWLTHLVVRAIFGERASGFGPVARSIGVVVSVLAVLAFFVPMFMQMLQGTPPRERP